MEKIIISMAASLLFSLLSDSFMLKKNVQAPPQRVIQRKESLKTQIKLPDYVFRVPKGHFAGISVPSKSIQKARMSSINNTVKQIIRAMGAQYHLTYKDRTYGDVNHIKRAIEDDLEILAEWFVQEVEQNIIRTDHITDEKGFHTFFTLIWFPDEKIEKMRTLTIGPKVMARVVSVDEDLVEIEIAEINGVGVTLYEYEINEERSYSRADFVSYYVFKVPKSKTLSFRKTFEKPVIIKRSYTLIAVPIPSQKTGCVDYLLGSSQSIEICLRGYDEIGRKVVKTIALN